MIILLRPVVYFYSFLWFSSNFFLLYFESYVPYNVFFDLAFFFLSLLFYIFKFHYTLFGIKRRVENKMKKNIMKNRLFGSKKKLRKVGK